MNKFFLEEPNKTLEISDLCARILKIIGCKLTFWFVPIPSLLIFPFPRPAFLYIPFSKDGNRKEKMNDDTSNQNNIKYTVSKKGI